MARAIHRLDHFETQASIEIPAELGRRFLLFVDTEEEFDWTASFRRTATVNAMKALPAFHARLVGRGIVPTYLVTYPIVADEWSAELLRELVGRGAAEVGAQLHPWVTPPFLEQLSGRNSFAGNLPERLEADKLSTLVRQIEHATGRAPRVYRAGRYGIGRSTPRLLRRLGFALDVSVRPGFNYAREGGPDFRGFTGQPFELLPGLAALPLGVGFPGLLGRRGYRFGEASPWLTGLFARSRLASRVPLTPEGVPLKQAIGAVGSMLAAGTRLLSFSFHSPSLVPGCTPYVRSDADRLAFDRWWDGMFDELARRGVQPMSAAEFMAACVPPAASATASDRGL